MTQIFPEGGELRHRVRGLGFLGTVLSLFWVGGCSAESGRELSLLGEQGLPIVGGEPAKSGDYPSTVALTDAQGEPFCTGTLVSPRMVVTAAHCVEAKPLSNLRVVYGSLHPKAEPASSRLQVASATPHPEYNTKAATDEDGLGKVNDLGVLLLAEPLNGSRYTPVLPADDLESVLYPNRDIHIAGYGVYELPLTEGELYKAVTPHQRHTEEEMLAGEPGKPDTCLGDSGGPAYVLRGCELWLVGVTSRAWAQSQHACGDGGIYTLVSQYTAFLEQVAGESLPAGTGSGGGLPVALCEDGGSGDVQLDPTDSCLAATSSCNPFTGAGCNPVQGESCVVADNGVAQCKAISSLAGEGEACDQNSLGCKVGLTCGKGLRCERLCCKDSDCDDAGACLPFSSDPGTVGSCPLPAVAEAAGSAGAPGDGATLEASAQGGSPWDERRIAGDGGCGCRVGSSGSGNESVLIGLVAWLARRRRRPDKRRSFR